MKVRMTRLEKGVPGPFSLRTETILGQLQAPPVVGETVVILAEPLVEGADLRMVETSPVVKISGDVITTESGSRYWIQKE